VSQVSPPAGATRFNAECLAALDLSTMDRVLDVGCGTGAGSRAAAAVARSVVGIDLSPEMIGQAVRLANGIANVRFEGADAERLPFEDREFTAVLLEFVPSLPESLQAVREMARVLDVDRRLVIGDACADLRTARMADRILRLVEPGHVRLYRWAELGSFPHRAGLSRVMLRRLSGGGFAIAAGPQRVRRDGVRVSRWMSLYRTRFPSFKRHPLQRER